MLQFLLCGLFVGCVIADNTAVTTKSTKEQDMELFKVRTFQDVETHSLASKEVTAVVNEWFAKGEISEDLKRMERVGKLFQLAYALCKGSKCSAETLKDLMNYQSVVKNSLSTTADFVRVPIKALGYLVRAIKYAHTSKATSATSIRILQLANKQAGPLLKETDKIVASAQLLAKNVKENTIPAVVSDRADAENDRKNLEENIVQTTANLTAGEEKFTQYKAETESAISVVESDIKSAEEELALIPAPPPPTLRKDKKRKVALPPTTTIDPNELRRQELQRKIDQLKTDLRRKKSSLERTETHFRFEKTELNNKLAHLENERLARIARIDGMHNAEKALNMIISEFEKVMNIFVKMQSVWQKLSADVKLIASPNQDEKQGKVDLIKSFGYKWLAAAKVGKEEYDAIRNVDVMVDQIVNNLPSLSGAPALVKSLLPLLDESNQIKVL